MGSSSIRRCRKSCLSSFQSYQGWPNGHHQRSIRTGGGGEGRKRMKKRIVQMVVIFDIKPKGNVLVAMRLSFGTNYR